ncbi:hypothetical protein ACYX7E_10105 [Luteimonas sp. RIT-PG2_3]
MAYSTTNVSSRPVQVRCDDVQRRAVIQHGDTEIWLTASEAELAGIQLMAEAKRLKRAAKPSPIQHANTDIHDPRDQLGMGGRVPMPEVVS